MDDTGMIESAELALRGWTGEYLQVRRLATGDCRIWHADGRYLGLLVSASTVDPLEGVVYGPDGGYLADAATGRLTVDVARRRAGGPAPSDTTAYASPGDIDATERRWPRRELPQTR